jgi:hypothetical protein
VKTPAASVFAEEALPSQATHTSDGNRPGAIATGQPSEPAIAQTAGGASGRNHRGCMEGAEPAAQTLHDVDGSRQGPEKDNDRGRKRTAGLYLGHRHQGRSCLEATNSGRFLRCRRASEILGRHKVLFSAFDRNQPGHHLPGDGQRGAVEIASLFFLFVDQGQLMAASVQAWQLQSAFAEYTCCAAWKWACA